MLGVAATATPSVAARPWPVGVDLPSGEPISENYRRQFALCDDEGSFRGYRSRYTRGCAGDPNRVTALRRLPGGAIAYVSKLAVDLDGSAFACGPNHGRMDQCPTSLMLTDAAGREVPVDADAVPYVVIPEAGPPDVAGEFARLTGVHVGDFGVVIANGRVVPVIVADTVPYSKLGEGSLALHRALGKEQCATKDQRGVCSRVDDEGQSISSDVTTIIYPGSARNDLTPRNIAAVVRREGMRLWTQSRPK
ncbi:glycoside hydrolase family 75 protein [Sphingomonas nostoxanthinifaciens]|nr:glycoside hydrolase family 75 protein [Sphingomonas nostoxanthinifaciens]